MEGEVGHVGKERGTGSWCRREGIATGWKTRGKGRIKFEVSGRKFDHIPSKA